MRKRMKRSFRKSNNFYQRMLKKCFFFKFGGGNHLTQVCDLYTARVTCKRASIRPYTKFEKLLAHAFQQTIICPIWMSDVWHM